MAEGEVRQLSLTGALVPPDQFSVARVRGREALSELFHFEIDLVSNRPDIDLEALVLSEATLTFQVGETIRHFHGFVFSASSVGELENKYFHYRVILTPRYGVLNLMRHNHVYQHQTLSQIIETELAIGSRPTGKDFFALGLDGLAYELRIFGDGYPSLEYTVQYQETDFNFLSRLMEKYGLYYFFEHVDGKDTLVVCDDGLGFPGADRDIAGSLRRPGAPYTSTRILSFSQDVLPMSAAVALNDYNYRTPLTSLFVEQVVDDAGVGEVYRYGEHFKTREEGAFLAARHAEALAVEKATFHGLSIEPALGAGHALKLEGHYRKSLDGRYRLRAVEHTVYGPLAPSCGLFEPTDGVSRAYANRFECFPDAVPFRPPLKTPRPSIVGVINAHIDGKAGTTAEMDEEGRYNVRLPFDISGSPEGKASRHIRLATPYGGRNEGMHFPLRPGTEVLLAHVLGDPDRPIIVGTVPNPVTPSVTTRETANTGRITNQSGATFLMGHGPARAAETMIRAKPISADGLAASSGSPSPAAWTGPLATPVVRDGVFTFAPAADATGNRHARRERTSAGGDTDAAIHVPVEGAAVLGSHLRRDAAPERPPAGTVDPLDLALRVSDAAGLTVSPAGVGGGHSFGTAPLPAMLGAGAGAMGSGGPPVDAGPVPGEFSSLDAAGAPIHLHLGAAFWPAAPEGIPIAAIAGATMPDAAPSRASSNGGGSSGTAVAGGAGDPGAAGGNGGITFDSDGELSNPSIVLHCEGFAGGKQSYLRMGAPPSDPAFTELEAGILERYSADANDVGWLDYTEGVRITKSFGNNHLVFRDADGNIIRWGYFGTSAFGPMTFNYAAGQNFGITLGRNVDLEIAAKTSFTVASKTAVSAGYGLSFDFSNNVSITTGFDASIQYAGSLSVNKGKSYNFSQDEFKEISKKITIGVQDTSALNAASDANYTAGVKVPLMAAGLGVGVGAALGGITGGVTANDDAGLMAAGEAISLAGFGAATVATLASLVQYRTLKTATELNEPNPILEMDDNKIRLQISRGFAPLFTSTTRLTMDQDEIVMLVGETRLSIDENGLKLSIAGSEVVNITSASTQIMSDNRVMLETRGAALQRVNLDDASGFKVTSGSKASIEAPQAIDLRTAWVNANNATIAGQPPPPPGPPPNRARPPVGG